MPHVPGCEAVYKVANQWRDRCLKSDGSLLWPDLDEPTWTVESLDQVQFALGELVALATMRDHELNERLRNESAATKRVAADIFAIWSICPGFPTPQGRKKALQRVVVSNPLKAELTPIYTAIDCEIGKPEALWQGMMYQAGRGWDLHFLSAFGQAIKTSKVDVDSFTEMRDLAISVEQGVGWGGGARLMVLHMLFPEMTEPIFNGRARKEILNANQFAEYRAGISDEDQAIVSIRSRLEAEGAEQYFSFFQEPYQSMWAIRNSNRRKVSAPQLSETSVDAVDVHARARASQLDNLESLVQATNLGISNLQQIESLTHTKKQIILEGPPGSGKTYVARLLARYLAGVPLDAEVDEHVEIVQFHQSYGYEDFVAGIRPVTGANGQLTYETRPGVFLEMCRRALENPDETYVLIIDEINRGNLSRIFGELLYGLEYRDQPVRMQYPVEIDGEPVQHLTIPGNLYLIGTMNSTDRSLAMIDYALRRRFYFWRLTPTENGTAPVLQRWLEHQEGIGPADRAQLLATFIELNAEIARLLGPDYQIGHSYFMLNDGQLADPFAREQVWRYAIEPLLREYFHTRHDAEAHIAKMATGFMVAQVDDIIVPDDELAE